MNQVDPMAGKYSGMTPYNFSFNSPAMYNDINGADPAPGESDFVTRRGYQQLGNPLTYNPYGTTTLNTIYRGSNQASFFNSGWGVGNGSLSYASFAAVDARIAENNSEAAVRDAFGFNVKAGTTLCYACGDFAGLSKDGMIQYYYNTRDSNIDNGSWQTQGGRPKFEGGVMYPDVAQGLYDMWAASGYYKGEGRYMENVGIFTSKGLLVLPNRGNSVRSPYKPLGSFRFLGSIISKDQTTLTYGGFELKILGMVHTHPDASGLPGHSPYDQSADDWLYVGGQVGSFVISHSGLYQGQTDLVTSTPLGPLNDKTITKFIINKYEN